jgi:glycosyltransferase involved in cell wall biosynthesis
MRIVIAAVSSSTQLSGVTRHAANVARCLLTRSDVSAVHLIVAPWQHDFFREAVSCNDSRFRIHAVPVANRSFSRNLWYYSDLPAIATQLKADLVHLTYPAPLHSGAFQCPTVVSLHDLYPYEIPSNFGSLKVLFNLLVLEQCLHSVDAIACVSDSTRQQLALRASNAVVEKSVTIYNCVEPPALASAHSPLPCGSGISFILCVAQHRRNKNILLALRVFQRLLRHGDINPSTLMVIVGISGPETSRILRFIQTAGLAQRVVLLSGISDAELHWCYRHCELLFAPSIVEGFGLPVAEALLVGCRIVCSDIPAFRELGGDHCRYVPLGPSAEEAFSEAIRAVLLERRGRPLFLPHLSARTIADQYLTMYRKTISRACAALPIATPDRATSLNQTTVDDAVAQQSSQRFDASRP